MAWWQGVLIILGFIVAGTAAGLLLSKLILRIKKQRSYSHNYKHITVIGEESELNAGVSSPPTKAFDEYKNITVIESELDTSAPSPLTKIYDDFKNIAALGKQSELSASVPSPPDTAISEKQETLKAPEIVECATDQGNVDTVRQQAELPESQVKSEPSDLSAEVKQNLAIASTPWTGKLLSFQPNVWDTKRAEACSLPLNLQHELVEAYTDMHLANNIAWLSINVGQRSAELDDNYVKLCSRIKERLNKVTPALLK